MEKLHSLYALAQKTVFGLGLTALVLSVSCTTAVEPTSAIDEAAVAADIIAQADFDEVDDLSSNAMIVADGGVGGRIAGMDDERMRCAVVTHDLENNEIIIDFGDGCTGPHGVTRAGKIIINYQGRRFVPGSYWRVSFDSFYVNRRHIEGIRTVTNISESLEANPTFHVVLAGGKVTWPDGSFATREVDLVREWVRAANPLLDEYHILAESTTSGSTKESVRFNSVVLEDLIIKRACMGPKRGRLPVAGIKEVTIGNKTYTIDFGDGECDTLVTVTVDGESRTIDLSDR